ncbi:MAG: creatininase family protein [Chloroflexi bacterium]|nr:creatininase family protein [Chloroflexota bacterium]
MTGSPAYVLTQMFTVEVGAALKTVKLAIIPTGSCEQHGPNMTMETDAAICYAIAERLNQQLYPRAILTPVAPWGVSSHHMNFPGTISLQPETYLALLWDVVTSLKAPTGFSTSCLWNGHGGNMDMLNVISSKCAPNCISTSR